MSILDDARPGMNPDIRPQDDLFGHVNGRWLDETEIPSDRSSWGPFVQLADVAEQQVRDIITSLAETPADDLDEEARKIGDLFASFMDEEAIDRLGTRPIQPLVNAVEGLRDVRDLAAFLGEFERIGGAGLFGSYIDTDDRNSDRYLFHITQGGLGLPDESYYREDKFAEIREAYVGYLTRLLELGGHADPAAAAQTVLDLDTRLAKGHWERAETRDVQKTYNLMTLEELQALAPAFDWEAYATNLGGSAETIAESCVRQPSYLAHLSTVLEEVDIEQWRPWLLSSTCCARPRPTCPTRSSRPTSTSTAAPSTARPSCASGGSVASRWSRGRSARPSAGSTSTATSRRSPRRRWTTSSPTCSRPTASPSRRSTG